MEIIPGRSVGPFFLGSPIRSVLAHLVSGQRLKYDTDFLFDEKAPYNFDIVLDLKNIGIQLRFDPITQRLWTIDVYDIGKMNLAYGGEIFAGMSQATPTLRVLYRLFGPTFPGKFDTDLDCYILSYRGLSFAFQVPHQAVKPQEIPMTLPDGTEPLATRLLIHVGPDLRKINLPRELCIGDSHVFVSLYVSKQKNGGCTSFTVHMLPSNAFVQYNDTVQHVLSELGTPSSTYDKVEDKMKIHRGHHELYNNNNMSKNNDNKTETTSDYFYNYFSLGMDILFDGETHTVKKVVLHTNIPGQSAFNQYSRCHYQLRQIKTDHISFVKRSRFTLNELDARFNIPFSNNNNNTDTDYSESSRETSPIPLPLNNNNNNNNNNNSLIQVIASEGNNNYFSSSNQIPSTNNNNTKSKKKKKKKKKKGSSSSFLSSGNNNNNNNSSNNNSSSNNNNTNVSSVNLVTEVQKSNTSDTNGGGGRPNLLDVNNIGLLINEMEDIDVGGIDDEESSSSFLIQSNTTWAEIETCMGSKAAGPMIRAPPDSGKYDTSGRMCAPSPFPATKMYAYSGSIYEVLQNDYVSNVTLFCT